MQFKISVVAICAVFGVALAQPTLIGSQQCQYVIGSSCSDDIECCGAGGMCVSGLCIELGVNANVNLGLDLDLGLDSDVHSNIDSNVDSNINSNVGSVTGSGIHI